MKRYRCRVLRDAARDQACVICGRQDGTVVLAHLPGSLYGMPAGIGQKVHDWLGCWTCHRCHHALDTEGRRDTQLRMKALCLTLEQLFDKGILEVKRDSRSTRSGH